MGVCVFELVCTHVSMYLLCTVQSYVFTNLYIHTYLLAVLSSTFVVCKPT